MNPIYKLKTGEVIDLEHIVSIGNIYKDFFGETSFSFQINMKKPEHIIQVNNKDKSLVQESKNMLVRNWMWFNNEGRENN